MGMFHLWLGLLFLIALLKWGDLKNWRDYYPTILYFGMGDVLYNFLVKDRFLWQWQSGVFTHTFVDIIWICTVFPAIVLIFLPHYPKSIKKQILYTLSWSSAFALFEFIIHRLGYITYHNGWAVWHSIVFYFILFPMLQVHSKNPLIAWLIYFILAYGLIYFFGLPLRILT